MRKQESKYKARSRVYTKEFTGIPLVVIRIKGTRKTMKEAVPLDKNGNGTSIFSSCVEERCDSGTTIKID